MSNQDDWEVITNSSTPSLTPEEELDDKVANEILESPMTKIIIPAVAQKIKDTAISTAFWTNVAFSAIRYSGVDWKLSLACSSVSICIMVVKNRQTIYKAYQMYNYITNHK